MAHWRIITQAANLKFGRRLRRLRRASGLSQVELGRRANVGRRFISEVELGNGNPTLGTMAMIAAGLGCELADLFKSNKGTSAGQSG